MRQEKSLFWKILLGFVAVFAVVLVIAVAVAWNWLRDFEASQPKYVAEEVFNTYFKDFDAAAYVKICKTDSKFESDEDLAAYLEEVTKGQELTYQRISSAEKDTYKYMIKAGDTKIATFMLTVDEGKDSDFKEYTASDFELFTAAKGKAVITAPKGYTVFVNGIELDDGFITEKDIKTPSCDHMPEGVQGTLLDKYTVTGLLATPTVSAKDLTGADAVVENENNTYSVLVTSDEALKSEYHEYVLEAIEKYAVYCQYDSRVAVMGFGQIKGYFDPESDLYEDIRTLENMFVIEYSSYDFEDEETGEYVRYDANTFSCRVSFTHILHRNGMDDYKDYLDLTIYLRRVGDDYLIYDMSQN